MNGNKTKLARRYYPINAAMHHGITGLVFIGLIVSIFLPKPDGIAGSGLIVSAILTLVILAPLTLAIWAASHRIRHEVDLPYAIMIGVFWAVTLFMLWLHVQAWINFFS